MKNRNICQICAMLLFFLVGISGCDKLASAQVVGEKKAEKNTQETEQTEITLTVREQVQAPEIYAPSVQEEIQAKDGHKIRFSLRGEAPVIVPKVEAIRTKKVTRSSMGKDQAEQWLDVLSEGQEINRNTEKDRPVEEGTVEIDDLEYTYYYSAHEPEEGIYVSPSFQWTVKASDGSGYYELLEGLQGYWKAMNETETLAQIGQEAETLLEKLGLEEFQICGNSWDPLNFMKAGEESKQGKMAVLKWERMVDGVPVTYYSEASCPYYTASGEAGKSIGDADTASWWEQEKLFYMALKPGQIWHFSYQNPIEITEDSDEKLFLLPFSEIQKIFEDTMEARLGNMEEDPKMMAHMELMLHLDEQKTKGTLSEALQSMEYELKKVQLGYMRVREENSKTEGTLIPVWDFFGTWKASTTMADGTQSTNVSELSDTVLLTLDARDGTVLQRMWGY